MEKQIFDYIQEHPDFLESYILDNVDIDLLERWIIRKMKRDKATQQRKTSLSRWKFCVHADKRKMLQAITESLRDHPTKEQVMLELGSCISSAVGADGFEIYQIHDCEPGYFYKYSVSSVNVSHKREINKIKISSDELPAIAYAAKHKDTIRLSANQDSGRFKSPICSSPDAEHVMCHPIIQPDGETATVLEIWRYSRKFHEEDEEISSSYLVWGGIALHYAHLFVDMNKQKNLSEFLLTVVKSIFQDMISMETLVKKIMNFAQRLVDADRASLFLVDSKNKELYATIFDVGLEGEPKHSTSDSEDAETKKKCVNEIRIPVGTGIAGHVAETGEILNITNAYDDDRFNRTVDRLTGYKTETILCMPIYIRNAIIGVVQMVNKHSGYFTKTDEDSFKMFAVYCGLALHHAKLYDKIKKSEQKYKVALEVLSYHNTCTEDEVEIALRDVEPSPGVGIDSFYFNPFVIGDYQKASHAIYMFTDLFGLHSFERNSLVKFVLTVKKNYRRVPYHNWTHGFSVSNCMYNILKKNENFTPNEALALFIGSLCHDLDHRGKNNKFMLETESPLAAIYSTSTMEHHHFNQTVTILQQEGHNIFAKLTNTDYKKVLGMLKQCILATDLAMFFPNKAKLTQLVKDQEFDWNNKVHRNLILAISMTAADLSASAKPWDIQVETVRVILEEFYDQGDAERSAGRQPIPMMDRNRPEEQASSQVGFLTSICLPCYDLLKEVLPETAPLLEMCEKNLKRWKSIDEKIKGDFDKTQEELEKLKEKVNKSTVYVFDVVKDVCE